MKTKLLVALALLTLGVSSASAQTATFTWTGGASKSGVESAQFATIDNYTTNASFGFSGYVSINGGNFLNALSVPEPGTCSIPRNPDGSCSGLIFPDFPNDGRFGSCSVIVWGQNQWGTRADGSIMDGTKAGDYYTRLGTASCNEWNGSVNISLTEFREFINHPNCGPRGCHPFLVDTLESGSGTASCVAGSGTFGACGS